jgi:hypothetical protein
MASRDTLSLTPGFSPVPLIVPKRIIFSGAARIILLFPAPSFSLYVLRSPFFSPQFALQTQLLETWRIDQFVVFHVRVRSDHPGIDLLPAPNR